MVGSEGVIDLWVLIKAIELNYDEGEHDQFFNNAFL